MVGANIPINFLLPSHRKKEKIKRCIVCLKVLSKANKSRLCGIHWNMERSLNVSSQGFYKY